MSQNPFAALGVRPDLVASLASRGITTPTPIQTETLPDALAGHDICGRAPTGSGKTIAFGIPLVSRVGLAEPRLPRALVLVPTRELASQVRDELAALAGRERSVIAVYGGVGFEPQIKALRRGVDIVVACPGRLADLLQQGQLRLDGIELVVIDEADRLSDMGFLPEIRRILDRCPKERQTLLFSATLDREVDVLVRHYQSSPRRHELVAHEDDSSAEHHFWSVERHQRIQTTALVVSRVGPTVVFCRTKRGADRLARQLEAAGVTAAAIHGDRSQSQRERALQSFHEGRVAALVATDVAARGIHVDGVAGVVHYDPPADHKDYVHRSGRTARAGNDGVVISLVPPELRKPVAILQRDLGVEVGLRPIAVDDLTEIVIERPRVQSRTEGQRSDRALDAGRTRSRGSRRTGRGGVRAGGRPSNGKAGARTGKPGSADGGRSGGRGASSGGSSKPASRGTGRPTGKPGKPGKPGSKPARPGKPAAKQGGGKGARPGGKPASRRNDRARSR